MLTCFFMLLESYIKLQTKTEALDPKFEGREGRKDKPDNRPPS